MNEQMMTTVSENAGSGELMNFDYDNILAVADRADKMVSALNKIMRAAVKITSARDWVLIGGTPYLQESGATKVARLFGIGWKILDQHAEYDQEGYPTYHYRMAFTMASATVECEGSRSARDEFFAGARYDRDGNEKQQKSPDQIDLRDVQQAAFTNCLNNGIKRILPGLRNLDMAALEEAGINLGQARGYAFRDGSRGGRGSGKEESGIVCAGCGTPISQKVASYSQGKFGRPLCMNCQKTASGLPDDEGR